MTYPASRSASKKRSPPLTTSSGEYVGQRRHFGASRRITVSGFMTKIRRVTVEGNSRVTISTRNTDVCTLTIRRRPQDFGAFNRDGSCLKYCALGSRDAIDD